MHPWVYISWFFSFKRLCCIQTDWQLCMTPEASHRCKIWPWHTPKIHVLCFFRSACFYLKNLAFYIFDLPPRLSTGLVQCTDNISQDQPFFTQGDYFGFSSDFFRFQIGLKTILGRFFCPEVLLPIWEYKYPLRRLNISWRIYGLV